MKMVEFEESFNGEKVEICDGVSQVKKFVGVTKNGNKWRARLRDPKLKRDIYLGHYSTPEEAAVVVKRKRLEFQEIFKGEDRSSDGKEVETRDGVSEVKKKFVGVSKTRNRWQARVRDPKLRCNVNLGCYSTPEEAAAVVKKKKLEFEEIYKGEADGLSYGKEVEIRDGVSEVKKKFVGVSKTRNMWQARVRDPKLRCDVYLGCYRTPEEAAVAVEKKKLEFEEIDKGGDGLGVKSCKGYFDGVRLPCGVRRDNGKWRVQLWHPKLKCLISGGSYETCEEAAIVAETKRAEFRGLQEPESEEAAIVAEKRVEFRNLEEPEPEIEVAGKSECLDEQMGDVKVPPGVTRLKSGKWVAKIRDPVLTTLVWVGTYDTADEAIASFNKKNDLLAAKMTKSSTSLVSADNLNNIAFDDESKNGVVNNPSKLGNGLVYSSPTSVLEAENENSNSVPMTVSDKTCGLDIETAVSSGLINEYGQLLGDFSELDEQMWLSFPS
ncbi:hypothetical protein RND81_11G060900 [Saponaria officinalis]|uniref:AP2/ERF domain-containing protein n=1 Tax=Saponaria officinalis TaxID=3572 RepID=A0AAW1HID2_SAPOF